MWWLVLLQLVMCVMQLPVLHALLAANASILANASGVTALGLAAVAGVLWTCGRVTCDV